MPDLKISQLTAGDPALASDEIPAARSGANVRLTAQSIADLASGSTPSDFQPAIVTGRYYFPPIGTTILETADVDTLVAWPFWASHTETWTRIGFYVNTPGTTEKIRIGIYENSTGNVPGALVVDAGEVTLSGSAEQELTISESLTANTLYWLAYVSNDALGAVEFRVISLEDSGAANIGAYNASWLIGASDGNPVFGMFPTRAFTYGALPDPFGTPDGLTNESIAIWLRKV